VPPWVSRLGAKAKIVSNRRRGGLGELAAMVMIGG
jgi:hypothetical protein